MDNYFRLLLVPFSLLYGVVIKARNWLFDAGFLRSESFNLPVICVGNLAVGGSGKTPVTEYLVHLLKGKKIAILSRGYGRKTKGFILADETATANSIGDEPFQYYRKFTDVTVAVCEDRVKGVRSLMEAHDVIILDDAFQHRSLKAGLNILLFEYPKLFRPKLLLPAGDLREPFDNYKRADIILVTKSPAIVAAEAKTIIMKMFTRCKQGVFFSAIEYQELIPVFNAKETANLNDIGNIYLLTGIANPSPLLKYLDSYSKDVFHHEYPDHHRFNYGDILKLVDDFTSDPSTNKLVLTTEKDAQRLLDDTIKELLLDLPVFYLPIKVGIERTSKKIFDQIILNYVSGITRNC